MKWLVWAFIRPPFNGFLSPAAKMQPPVPSWKFLLLVCQSELPPPDAVSKRSCERPNLQSGVGFDNSLVNNSRFSFFDWESQLGEHVDGLPKGILCNKARVNLLPPPFTKLSFYTNVNSFLVKSTFLHFYISSFLPFYISTFFHFYSTM